MTISRPRSRDPARRLAILRWLANIILLYFRGIPWRFARMNIFIPVERRIYGIRVAVRERGREEVFRRRVRWDLRLPLLERFVFEGKGFYPNEIGLGNKIPITFRRYLAQVANIKNTPINPIQIKDLRSCGTC